MKSFREERKRISYVNGTGVAIASEDVVVGTDGIGVVVADIAAAAGSSGVLEISGVHELDAASAESWDVLEALYWDTVALELTQTASGNVYAGLSAKVKAALETTAYVSLNA